MVIARTKLMIHDDLLRPNIQQKIHYTGPHPEKLYKEIPDLLRSVFRVTDESLHEKKFQWSKGDPEKFSISWEIDKDLDNFSYYYIIVKLDGQVSKGQGSADVVLEGGLRTEYPQDTMWQRSIFYEILRMIWHNLFYSSKRHKYYLEGRRLMGLFIEKVKELARV